MSPSTSAKSKLRIPAQLNPFGESAFGTPWNEIPADVPSINDAAFRAVLSELDQVRMGGKASIVITGEPGSGKTHLLGRLRRTIGQEVAYIYVRCNASAVTLWRHVRAAIASDLLKQESGEPSRLQRLLQRKPDRLDALTRLSLRRVLQSYGEGRYAHAASAWLRGEALPQSDLDALGIGAEREDEERSRETEAKDAVNGLLEFLSPDPAVLCFDQVEALETYRGDKDGFHTMGTLIAELYDVHDHLLLVSCIVSEFENRLEQLTNKANYDRWCGNKVNLAPIKWEDALKLVAGRLDSSPDLAPLRRQHPQDPLWPLNAEALKPLFEATGLCLPRTLIQACRTHFESLFGEPGPKLSREDFLQQEYERNVNEARIAVARQGADKTVAECLPWLLENSGFSPLGADADRSRYANLAFQKEGRAFAVSLCYSRGNELTGRLRRIERYWQLGNVGLKILRDPSVKPGLRGEQLLGTLRSRGAQEVHPLPEALAALQAIHNMITAARSGDLTQDGQGISEREVTQWSLANLPPQLETLRDELIGREASRESGDAALAKLAALLAERKVLEAEIAAKELSMTMEEVSACARRHPMRFGLLAGPPMVLFQAIEGSAPETSHA
jgi:hypothetical protein